MLNSMNTGTHQLSSLLDHSDLKRVFKEVSALVVVNFGRAVVPVVEKAFRRTWRAFSGRMRGYQACNTEYHNFAHTVDVFVATARLLDGYGQMGWKPEPRLAALTLVAALLHDIGYLVETGDTEGTGAKYTKIHVLRGVEFLHRHYKLFGIEDSELNFVSRLIWGTDLGMGWDSLGFVDDQERTLAAIVATADLLGQMADRSYLEKLLFLFYEFQEAGIGNYQSAFDVLKTTRSFYEAMRLRMDTVLERAYVRAQAHFSSRYQIHDNLYITAIERQLVYLKTIMDDTTANFRKKLKRLDLEVIEGRRRA